MANRIRDIPDYVLDEAAIRTTIKKMSVKQPQPVPCPCHHCEILRDIEKAIFAWKLGDKAPIGGGGGGGG